MEVDSDDERANNSAIFTARRQEDPKKVEQLLAMDAKDSVENEKKKKPLDLAKNEKTYRNSRSDHDKSVDDGHRVANESTEKLPYDKNNAASGGIRGQLYEIRLAMLFLLHGTLETKEKKMDRFFLRANLKLAGNFDDVVYKRVYRYEEDLQRSKVLFMQCKHKHRERSIVTLKELLSMKDEKKEFSLKHYYRSYREIRNQFTQENSEHPIFSSKLAECEFVIITNALLGDYKEYKEHFREFPVPKTKEDITIREEEEEEDYYRNEFVEEHSVFNFGGINSYFKLSLDGSRKEELMRVMRSSSECLALANKLTEAVFSGKVIDLNKDVTEKYHWALANYVLEGEERNGKFRETFLNYDDGTELFKHFFAEVMRRPEWNGENLVEVKKFLSGKNIGLPENFGTITEEDEKLELPTDIVTENTVKDFFGKLKLIFGQPNVEEIGKIIEKKMGEAYRITKPEMEKVYAVVQKKVTSWWQKGDEYLTEENRFYEETAKIPLGFDVMEPVRLFTGRESELQKLNETLRNPDKDECSPESRMTCLGGFSGVGKTELVRKYIRIYSKEYDDNIVWINAETEESRIASFRTLAQDELHFPANTDEEECDDVISIVAKIYAFFCKRTCLFIFDCVGDLENIRAFLPPGDLAPGTQRPYVLLTSCNDSWDNTIETIRLGPLEPMEAEYFVKNGLEVTTNSENDTISKLVELLHYFPIAIDRAISYIRDETYARKVTIEDYIKIYEKRWKELLESSKLRDIESDCEQAAVVTAILNMKSTLLREKLKSTQSGRKAFEVLQ